MISSSAPVPQPWPVPQPRMWVSPTLFSGSEFQANLALNPSRRWRDGPMGPERSGYRGQARILLPAATSALIKYSGPNKSGGFLSPKSGSLHQLCGETWDTGLAWKQKIRAKPSLGRFHSRSPGCSLPWGKALLNRLASSLSSGEQSVTIHILSLKSHSYKLEVYWKYKLRNRSIPEGHINFSKGIILTVTHLIGIWEGQLSVTWDSCYNLECLVF